MPNRLGFLLSSSQSATTYYLASAKYFVRNPVSCEVLETLDLLRFSRETISSENTDLFFPALDLLTSPNAFPEPIVSLNAKALYDASLRLLEENHFLSSPGFLNTLEMSIALHTCSPTIQAYYEYYRDRGLENTRLSAGESTDDCTGSWVLWNDTKVCSVKTLDTILGLDLGLTGYVWGDYN